MRLLASIPLRRQVRVASVWAVVVTIPVVGSVARASDWLVTAASIRDTDASARAAGVVTAGWRLSLEPTIWAPGLGGDTRFGAGEATAERFQVDLPHPSAALRFDARRGDLSISASGFAFFLDKNTRTDAPQAVGAVAFAAGDPAEFRFNLVSAELTVGTRVWERTLPAPGAEHVVRIGVDAFGGLRAYALSALVAAPGGAAVSDSGAWVEPIVGARLQVDILRNAGFYLALDAGGMPIGNHTSSSFDILTGIQWRPLGRVGLEFGWRQIILNLQDGAGPGRFEFDGALAGLFGSLVIRF